MNTPTRARPIGADYAAMNNPAKGGSKPGRKTRRMSPPLKLALHRWALAEIAKDDETVFTHSPRSWGSRWTRDNFTRALEALHEHLPIETELWAFGRKDPVGNLIDRHHKMYWGKNRHHRGRYGKTSEHVDFWSSGKRAAAELYLHQAKFPWSDRKQR